MRNSASHEQRGMGNLRSDVVSMPSIILQRQGMGFRIVKLFSPLALVGTNPTSKKESYEVSRPISPPPLCSSVSLSPERNLAVENRHYCLLVLGSLVQGPYQRTSCLNHDMELAGGQWREAVAVRRFSFLHLVAVVCLRWWREVGCYGCRGPGLRHRAQRIAVEPMASAG